MAKKTKPVKTICVSLTLIAAMLLSMGMLATPVHSTTNFTQQAIELSNEGPGYAITALIKAGYGGENIYQTLVDIHASTNPSLAGIITTTFLQQLANCPASSMIFIRHLNDYSTLGRAILIGADGTVQDSQSVLIDFRGSHFQSQTGTATLETNLAGVGSFSAVHNSTAAPLTSYNVTFQNAVTTYNIFAVLYAPSNLNTTQSSFVLSNEAPGYGISALVTAGYGDYNLYDALIAIQANTNPSAAIILSDKFFLALASLPNTSPTFTTQLKDVNSPGTSIAISTDGTYQTVNIDSSSYQGTQKSSTLNMEVSGVGNYRAIYNSTATPLTSWTNSTNEGETTYNVFGILFNPSSATTSSPTASPQVPEFPPTAILLGLIIVSTMIASIHKRKQATKPKTS